MKLIPLTKGHLAKVDDADFAELSKYKWHVLCPGRNKYAAGSVNGSYLLMHRFLLKAPKGMLIDHKNTDSLDNQRANLRLGDKSTNGQNRGKQINNTSGFKGVNWHKRAHKWMARIKANGKIKYLGIFDDINMAYAAYCKAAKELHGEFARYE